MFVTFLFSDLNFSIDVISLHSSLKNLVIQGELFKQKLVSDLAFIAA